MHGRRVERIPLVEVVPVAADWIRGERRADVFADDGRVGGGGCDEILGGRLGGRLFPRRRARGLGRWWGKAEVPKERERRDVVRRALGGQLRRNRPVRPAKDR